MNENICAPSKFDNNNKTCFTLDQLKHLVEAYNRYITKINLGVNKNVQKNKSTIKILNDKTYLLNELKNRFIEICGDDEVCITKQSFMNEIVNEMRDDIEKFTFRPEGSSNPTEWLSTDDINNILYQYHTIYKDFIFLGAVPSDCSILTFCPLYGIKYDEFIDSGKVQLGIVYNTDRYGFDGEHWVALYIHITNGKIYYCDSQGDGPNEYMEHMIEKFIKYYKSKNGKNPEYKQNNNDYQKDKSECGIYSCNFIIRILSGESFDQIINDPLNFSEINSCRNVYFRNKPSKHTPNVKCDPN